ncbi:glycosyltransferase [Gordonia soli]|uniref:Putative glycosyltransferase n=1 Tax=Gordonia soli NBRC 108243 TaxID=1223545 RepID=M0QGB1_9ACTN|nr:glycosyltransferase [Gordonia soli]GAC67484.1 putative glycosyltransferase [Gordonia soli NBRC 108243]
MTAPIPTPEVLVVAYRNAEQLADCLASVDKHLPDARIRVWDNSEPDRDDIRQLATTLPGIDWHLGSGNLGFAAAVNRLARLVTAESFLLLNPDAVLVSDLAGSRLALSHDDVAAVAPMTRDLAADADDPNGLRPWDVAHRAPSVTRALVDHLWYSPRLRGTPLSSLHRDAPEDVSGYLTGACLLIDRAVWDQVGEFDEDFFLYGEETDWQRRARESGRRLVLADELGVEHTGHGTVADDPRAGLRSRDLLRAGVALILEKQASARHGDAYLAATAVLDRVQRSSRRSRARLREATASAKPAVIITVNRLVYGGAERHHVVLATELVRRGYPVTIACMQRFGPLIGEIPHEVRVVRQPWWAPMVDLPDGRAVVISGDTNTETGFATTWRATGSDRRWLVGAHVPPDPGAATYSRPLAAAMTRADGVVTLSPSHRDEMTRHQRVGRRHFVAPNGVIRSADLADSPDRRHAGTADEGPIRLVMLSRIVEHKNPHVLTAALADLQRTHPELDWTLDIFGDGPDRARLEAATPPEVAGRVRWRGWSPGPDHAMAEADVVCVPSRSEAFPMVIVEAMGRGLPVVATAVCSVPDMLDEGRAGFLVGEPTVEAWRSRLAEVLTDRRRLVEVGARGRDRMAAEYTVDAMADAYETAIAEVFG